MLAIPLLTLRPLHAHCSPIKIQPLLMHMMSSWIVFPGYPSPRMSAAVLPEPSLPEGARMVWSMFGCTWSSQLEARPNLGRYTGFGASVTLR